LNYLCEIETFSEAFPTRALTGYLISTVAEIRLERGNGSKKREAQ
jgi:hypothetical protein